MLFYCCLALCTIFLTDAVSVTNNPLLTQKTHEAIESSTLPSEQNVTNKNITKTITENNSGAVSNGTATDIKTTITHNNTTDLIIISTTTEDHKFKNTRQDTSKLKPTDKDITLLKYTTIDDNNNTSSNNTTNTVIVNKKGIENNASGIATVNTIINDKNTTSNIVNGNDTVKSVADNKTNVESDVSSKESAVNTVIHDNHNISSKDIANNTVKTLTGDKTNAENNVSSTAITDHTTGRKDVKIIDGISNTAVNNKNNNTVANKESDLDVNNKSNDKNKDGDNTLNKGVNPNQNTINKSAVTVGIGNNTEAKKTDNNKDDKAVSQTSVPSKGSNGVKILVIILVTLMCCLFTLWLIIKYRKSLRMSSWRRDGDDNMRYSLLRSEDLL